MNLEQLQQILFDVIKHDYRHANYQHVNELAAKYNMFYNGKGIDEELKKLYGIKTANSLVFSIVPPILKSTKFPFNKVIRTKPRIKRIDFENEFTYDKVHEIESKLNTFYYNKSFEYFVENIIIDKNYTDPNSWVVLDFKQFNHLVEKANPYPVVFSSSEVIDYKYNETKLEYIITCSNLEGVKTWTMYAGYYTLQMMLKKDVDISFVDSVIKKINGNEYILKIFEPKLKNVPAFRVGYIPDLETNGLTYVSIFDKIMPFLYKILKIDYETDCSLADMAFPKRYMFVEKCNAEGCRNGYLIDGSMCNACNGTGKRLSHSTSFDVMQFPMPNEVEEMFDLSKIAYTERPPVDSLRFQDEIRDKWKDRIFSLLFNSDSFDKTQVSATATAVVVNRDNLNDSIYPFAQHVSELYKMITMSIANLLDYTDVIVTHIYPGDFKFKSIADLMTDLKNAKETGLSSHVIMAIENDINEIIFSDRPDDLKKIRIRNEFNPFCGVNEETIRLIIASNQTTQYNAVLWSNLEPIFSELELEYNGISSKWFYDLEYNKIETLVGNKVNEYIKKLTNIDTTIKKIDFSND